MRGNRLGFLEAEDERSVLQRCLSLIAPVDPAFFNAKEARGFHCRGIKPLSDYCFLPILTVLSIVTCWEHTFRLAMCCINLTPHKIWILLQQRQ